MVGNVVMIQPPISLTDNFTNQASCNSHRVFDSVEFIQPIKNETERYAKNNEVLAEKELLSVPSKRKLSKSAKSFRTKDPKIIRVCSQCGVKETVQIDQHFIL
jgi:hypothetical protein